MSEKRKKGIIELLTLAEKPLSASYFAEHFGVTRQVIVGDIALLRASGATVIATPRGYILERKHEKEYIIACKHSHSEMKEELYHIVDCGCGVLDVVVEHPLYGQITCNLHLFSRLDVDAFLEKMENTQSRPISEITNDIHIHHLQCPSDEHFRAVVKVLREKGIYSSLVSE